MRGRSGERRLKGALARLAQDEEAGGTGGEARGGRGLGPQAMISAYDYYTKVARPTADRFLAQNNDIGLGLLASMATLHVIDYVGQNRKPNVRAANNLVNRLKARCRNRLGLRFQVLEGFALASKHCRLSNKNMKNFHSGNYTVAFPATAGVMRSGQSFILDTVGGITIRWKAHQYVNLPKALTETLSSTNPNFLN
jgi:hypothetical protein